MSARHGWTVVTLVASLGLAACDSGPSISGPTRTTIRPEDTAPGIKLTATSRAIYTGETATVIATTTNTLGKNAKIEWFSSYGALVEEDHGNKVRLRGDKPGRALIKATLTIPGLPPVEDFVTIEVKPLP